MLELSSRGASGRVISMNFWSTEDVDDVVLKLLDVEDLRLFLKYILVD